MACMQTPVKFGSEILRALSLRAREERTEEVKAFSFSVGEGAYHQSRQYD